MGARGGGVGRLLAPSGNETEKLNLGVDYNHRQTGASGCLRLPLAPPSRASIDTTSSVFSDENPTFRLSLRFRSLTPGLASWTSQLPGPRHECRETEAKPAPDGGRWGGAGHQVRGRESPGKHGKAQKAWTFPCPSAASPPSRCCHPPAAKVKLSVPRQCPGSFRNKKGGPEPPRQRFGDSGHLPACIYSLTTQALSPALGMP